MDTMSDISEEDRYQKLCYKWNRAASDVGICGSEYYDDPKAVFARVRQIMEARRELALDNARLRQELNIKKGAQ
jgi:hypothetical protein